MQELETIALPGSATQTTRVGFGCSNLLGDKTREMGLHLLETAYDCGIRHFDVARVYNFGDAEAIVGEFAANKRDRVTISTKFGLMPREGVAKMKGPVQIARSLMRSSSWIRKLVRRNVKNLTQKGQFDVATAQKSLEASLRALRTDYLDLYLMHECSAPDCTEEIYTFLEKAKQEGKIRAHGCGTAFGRVPAIVSEHPEFLPVVQFESRLTQPNVAAFKTMRPPVTELVITHGAMNAAAAVRARLSDDPVLKAHLEAQTGLDLLVGSNLYGFLLRYALLENAEGIVLFRAAAESRIRSTLEAMQKNIIPIDQLEVLQSLGRATL